MSSFTKKLIVSLDPKDKRYWYLEEDFKYYEFIDENQAMIITVPKGFRTDFASIPKILYALPFITDADKFNKAAVLHDFCYCTKLFDRKQCDELFYRAMEIVGIPEWKRILFYHVVRLFGRSHFGVKKGDPNYKLCSDENLKKTFLKIVKIDKNL
jgi:hypothetical protein